MKKQQKYRGIGLYMKIIIIGASGHGKIAFDALNTNTEFETKGFIDDNLKELNKTTYFQ